MKLLASGLFSVVLLFTGTQLRADEVEESRSLVFDYKRCLTAFECRHFALTAKESELADKLLLVGYESGRRFLEGLAKGKLLPKDSQEVFSAFGFVATGPSIDFILGRMYERAKDDLIRAIKTAAGDSWESVASTELDRRNAELIVEGFKPDPSLGAAGDEAWKRYLEYLQKLRESNEAKDRKAEPAEAPAR